MSGFPVTMQRPKEMQIYIFSSPLPEHLSHCLSILKEGTRRDEMHHFLLDQSGQRSNYGWIMLLVE
jgi:hypothetical protein